MLVLSLIFLAILLFVFTRLNYKKLSRVSSIVLCTIFALIALGWFPAKLLANLQTFPYGKTKLSFAQRNAIVLLGSGAVKINHNNFLPSIFAYSRIASAAETYFSCKKISPSCLIIISGGDPEFKGRSEAAVYTNELIKLGVSRTHIMLESKSVNTYENAKFSSVILKKGNFDQVFLVTSGFHLKRSMTLFSHFGISATPIAADYLKASSSITSIAFNFVLTEIAIHEYLGILEFKFFSLFPESNSIQDAL